MDCNRIRELLHLKKIDAETYLKNHELEVIYKEVDESLGEDWQDGGLSNIFGESKNEKLRRRELTVISIISLALDDSNELLQVDGVNKAQL